MTEQQLRDKCPDITPHEIAWRLEHPLLPDNKFERTLEIDRKEIAGHATQAETEEFHEKLEEYYPEEVE